MNPKSWEDSRDDLFPSRQEAVFRELTPVNIKPTNTNDFGLAASRRKERFCHGDVRAGTISGRGRGNDGTRRDALQSLPIPGSSVHSLVKANDSLAAASQSTAANKPLLNQSQMDWLDSGDAIKRHPKRNIETIVSTEDLMPRPFSETSSFGATTISLNTRQSSDIPFKPLLSASKNMTAKKPTQLSFFSPFTSSSSSSSSLSTVGRRSSKPSEVKAALQKSDIPRQHRLQIDLTETKDYEISTYRLYFGLVKTEACLNWKLCLSSSNKLTLKPDNSKMEKRSVGVAYNPLQMHPAIILYTDIEAIRYGAYNNNMEAYLSIKLKSGVDSLKIRSIGLAGTIFCIFSCADMSFLSKHFAEDFVLSTKLQDRMDWDSLPSAPSSIHMKFAELDATHLLQTGKSIADSRTFASLNTQSGSQSQESKEGEWVTGKKRGRKKKTTTPEVIDLQGEDETPLPKNALITPQGIDERARRSHRRRSLKFGEVITTDLTESSEEDGKTLFEYPEEEDAKDVVTLTIGDRKRLQPFVYLNDSIIDFRLRHFMRTILPVEVSSRTHVFSCQFFTRLSQEKDPFEAYKLVSSWTKQIDLLSLDFIVVPINDGAHWSLTIIVRPFLALKNLDLTMNADEDFRFLEESKNENQSCILFLDSLGLHVASKIHKKLLSYLNLEWRSRREITPEIRDAFSASSMPLVNLEKSIPSQPNGCDCGVYVIKYFIELLKQCPSSTPDDISDKFSRYISKKAFTQEDVDVERLTLQTLFSDLAENYAKRRLARRKEREEQADSQEKDSVLFPMAVILTANEGGSEVDNRISDEKKGLKRGEARCSENREGLRVNSNAAGSSSNDEDDELVIGQIQSRKYGRSDIQVKESEDKEAVPVSETETELDEEETEVKMELFNNNF